MAESFFRLRHGLERLQVDTPESGKLLKQLSNSNFVQTHLRRVMINGGVPLEQASPENKMPAATKITGKMILEAIRQMDAEERRELTRVLFA